MSWVIEKYVFFIFSVFHTLHKKLFNVDNFQKDIMIEIYGRGT